MERGVVRWDEVVEEARRNRAESCCYWTLRLGRATTALDVPEAVFDLLSPGHPGVVRRMLERHALDQILPSERRCPSVRLQRWLWTLAIRPDWSGHSRIRPWTHAADWEADGTTDGRERPPGAGSAPGRLSAWMRYARLMLGARP